MGQSTETDVAASPIPGAAERPGPDRPTRSAAEPAIVASGLGKTFRIPHDRPSTLKERVLHPLHRTRIEQLAALDGVSFEVAKGEFFGIVGRNGSGKSTLLKLIARIYPPDRGEVRVNGRLSPFIELGVGFNPELAARDNVIVNCSLLGLSRREALRRFDRIIEFAELEEFVDLKLRNYSSGMQVRLAFATAIQVDADVLLLDEVLAVGDSAFQEKCFEVFRQMRRDGKTVVLVTHALEMVNRFCDRAMLLDGGHPLAIGKTHEVIDRYQTRAAAVISADAAGPVAGAAHAGEAEILHAWFEGADGKRTSSAPQGERLTFHAEAVFHEAMEEPAFGLLIRDEGDRPIFGATSSWGPSTPSFEPGQRAHWSVSFENLLGVGTYFATAGVSNRDLTHHAAVHPGIATLLVRGERHTGGVVDLPFQLSVERM